MPKCIYLELLLIISMGIFWQSLRMYWFEALLKPSRCIVYAMHLEGRKADRSDLKIAPLHHSIQHSIGKHQFTALPVYTGCTDV